MGRGFGRLASDRTLTAGHQPGDQGTAGGDESRRGTHPTQGRRTQEHGEQGSRFEGVSGTTGGAGDAGRPGVTPALDEQEGAQAGQGIAAAGPSGVPRVVEWVAAWG